MPPEVQKQFKKKLKIMLENPKHTSLRLHELKGDLSGRISMSINKNHRAVYRKRRDAVEFINIGTHSIYTDL